MRVRHALVDVVYKQEAQHLGLGGTPMLDTRDEFIRMSDM